MRISATAAVLQEVNSRIVINHETEQVYVVGNSICMGIIKATGAPVDLNLYGYGYWISITSTQR